MGQYSRLKNFYYLRTIAYTCAIKIVKLSHLSYTPSLTRSNRDHNSERGSQWSRKLSQTLLRISNLKTLHVSFKFRFLPPSLSILGSFFFGQPRKTPANFASKRSVCRPPSEHHWLGFCVATMNLRSHILDHLFFNFGNASNGFATLGSCVHASFRAPPICSWSSHHESFIPFLANLCFNFEKVVYCFALSGLLVQALCQNNADCIHSTIKMSSFHL